MEEILKSVHLAPVDWPSTSEIPPEVLFVAGYRRTGKDTFASRLAQGKLEFPHPVCSPEPPKYRWEIYVPPNSTRDQPQQLKKFEGAETVAFSGALRDVVYDLLHLPPDFNYEQNKDTPLFGRKETLRDYMIAVGEMGRAFDSAYWVKRAFAPYFSAHRRRKVICSDLRFVAEHAVAAKVGITGITVRLFREAVSLPPANVVSEHNLDDFATDFLLTDDTVSISRLPPALSWYKTYRHACSVLL